MSPKAKILSDLKGEIKYFFRAAGAKFFEPNSCQSGFSFRKIVFGGASARSRRGFSKEKTNLGGVRQPLEVPGEVFESVRQPQIFLSVLEMFDSP